MSVLERQSKILAYINENGGASVKALCREFFISEPTARRDLTALEKMGAVKRNFGGALPSFDTNPQIPLFIREGMDSDAKNELCKKAAELIHDGDTVFIDGSSTVQHLVKYLKRFNDLTVVTYSLKAATYLAESHIKTYCTGGLLNESSLLFMGSDVLDFADKVNIDIAFMACKGVDYDGVFSDTSDIETPIRRKFLSRSKRRVFLMTKNKIGNKYFHTVCNSSEIDYLISDDKIPENSKLASIKYA